MRKVQIMKTAKDIDAVYKYTAIFNKYSTWAVGRLFLLH